ncbi:MAG: hypothetical protein IPJ57_09030 [Gemmatimonadetes bacterium]|nr:hypothetical protein [Gemmatimonadota bacterium]
MRRASRSSAAVSSPKSASRSRSTLELPRGTRISTGARRSAPRPVSAERSSPPGRRSLCTSRGSRPASALP